MVSMALALSPALTSFPLSRERTQFTSRSLRSSLSSLCSSPSSHSKIPSFSLKVNLCPVSAPALKFESEVRETRETLAKRKVLLNSLIWVAVTFVYLFLPGISHAADDSIKASGFGLKIASALRKSGWADEAIVFALATLPVLELRGAIPVGYWMRLDPVNLTILSILGNMVPVPLIILYLKKLATFLSQRSCSATRILDLLFERAREKAGPIEEFRWLGLMLFVAVPFPGTGAWTGAIIASILGMPFWPAVSANFVGVLSAGLLVNLLMNLGIKWAIVTGVALFSVSTVMWSVLRSVKRSMGAK